MGASLSWTVTVTNNSNTQATVKVVLKCKTTGSSYNNSSPSGYITIGGTKYTFSHNIPASSTTTIATKSKTITRTTSNQSIAVKASFSTGISAGTLTKSGTYTVSAKPSYTVTFYKTHNGSTGEINSTKTPVYYGTTTTFPTPAARSGYTFNHWNTAWSGTGTHYAAGNNTPTITANTSFYAQWDIINYSITYDLSDGTISGQPTSYTVETETFTLPLPSRTGYHFIGWTGANGDTPQVNVSIPIGSTENKTFIANWEINTYTINLDLGEADGEGGSVDPASLTKTHGIDITLPTPMWNRPFVGWSYNDSNIGTVCNIDGNTNQAEITLVALWSEEVRPVIYHYWSSATDVNNTYQTYKIIDNTLTLSIPKITNYEFEGWYTSDNFSGSAITTISNTYDYPTGDERYQNPEPIHIYGLWKEQYTIVYHINSPSYNDGITATGSIASISCKSGQTINLASGSNYQYKSGNSTKCTASGWSTTSGINNTISTIDGIALTDNATLVLSNKGAGYVLNLYAVWTPNKFTITLNKGNNSVTGTNVSIELDYFTLYTLPSVPPVDGQWVYSGHHLSSWQTGSTNIELGTAIRITNDITYTAQWASSYHVPVIIGPDNTPGITVTRYIDANYTSVNTGGKYIQIAARGNHGSYDGAGTITTHKYDVTVQFYSTSETDGATPVATYVLPTIVDTNTSFYKVWGKPISASDPTARPIYDKKSNMLYCVLTITDSTDYGAGADLGGKNIFTYEFEVPLIREVVVHIADDMHAISLFKELDSSDAGLVVHKNGNFKQDVNIEGTTTFNGSAIRSDGTPLASIKIIRW